MIVNELKFENFRNLEDNQIFPCEGMNIIIGDNGQGKTNLLECIWMFNGVKSFRGSKDKELVAFGCKKAVSEIGFFSEERNQKAEIRYENGKRNVSINGIKKPAPSYLFGKITSIVFSPDHLSLVKDGPGVRRKFIDSAICQIKPKYSIALARYNRALNQRNALLKDISRFSELVDTLSVWDKELALSGSVVICERRKYIDYLSKLAGEYHNGISESKENLLIDYKSCCSEIDSTMKVADEFCSVLEKNRKDDLNMGYTTKGPHRDDIEIYINQRSARMYASQGQQRSVVLSMKLAEASLVEKITGQQPVILLDDVLSELDKERQKFLLNKIKNTQVFITCCDYSADNLMKNGMIFKVNSGKVSIKNIY